MTSQAKCINWLMVVGDCFEKGWKELLFFFPGLSHPISPSFWRGQQATAQNALSGWSLSQTTLPTHHTFLCEAQNNFITRICTLVTSLLTVLPRGYQTEVFRHRCEAVKVDWGESSLARSKPAFGASICAGFLLIEVCFEWTAIVSLTQVQFSASFENTRRWTSQVSCEQNQTVAFN